MVLNDENSWDDILTPTMFALRATVHTMTWNTLTQLVFGQDSILNTRHKANWQLIEKHTQDLINKGNKQEYCNRKNTNTTKGTKMRRKANSTKTRIWVHIQSKLSEIMALLGPIRVKSQTPSRNKRSSIMGQYEMHTCTHL